MDLKSDFWDDIYSLENEEKPYSLYCMRLAQGGSTEDMRTEAERCINRLDSVLGDCGVMNWMERTVSNDAAQYLGKNIKKAIVDLKRVYDAFIQRLPNTRNGDKRTFDYGYLAFLAMNALFLGERLNAEREKIDERGDAWYCATDFLFSRDYVIAAYEELDGQRLHQDIIPSHCFNLYEREALRLFLSERYGKEFEFLWNDIAKEMLGNKTVGEMKQKTRDKYGNGGADPTMIAYCFTYALIFMATMDA